jgi:hypothetical protein
MGESAKAISEVLGFTSQMRTLCLCFRTRFSRKKAARVGRLVKRNRSVFNKRQNPFFATSRMAFSLEVEPRVRKFILFWLLSAGILLLFFIFGPDSQSQPRFDGKPLFYWIQRSRIMNISAQESEYARAVVDRIGTNNLALLLKWFQEPDVDSKPSLAMRFATWFDGQWDRFRPQSAASQAKPLPSPHPSHATIAYCVFTDATNVTKACLPELIKLFEAPDDMLKGRACVAVSLVGMAAVPYLLTLLTSSNPINRALSIWAIGQMGTNAASLGPRCQAMLSDSNSLVRLNAAVALKNLGGDPHVYVPALIRLTLEAPEAESQVYAADELLRIQNVEMNYLSDLQNLMRDTTNANVRSSLATRINSLVQ